MKTIIWFFLILVSHQLLTAQRGAFYQLTSSRFARATSMGNAYTGIAEGAEAAYYNNAGLVFEKTFSIAYSNWAFHSACIVSKNTYPSHNLALSIPLNSDGNNISMLVTYSNKVMELPQNPLVINLSYSRLITCDLAIGIGINYYHSSLEPDDYIGDPPKSVFDFSFSALYKEDRLFSNFLNDQLKLGFKLNNLLSSDYSYIDEKQASPLAQEFRTGISYRLMPELLFKDYHYLKILFAFDAVWHLYDYKSDYLAPNWGVELTFLEILSLRYGREQIREIFCVYPAFHNNSITRMGAGINIPFKFLFEMEQNINLIFDITFSDWENIKHEGLEKPFFTVQLVYDFLK